VWQTKVFAEMEMPLSQISNAFPVRTWENMLLSFTMLAIPPITFANQELGEIPSHSNAKPAQMDCSPYIIIPTVLLLKIVIM